MSEQLEVRRKCYNEEDLKKALEAIRSGKMSQRMASRNYAIPRSTLQDKIHGRMADLTKIGPSTTLTKEEELKLVDWILYMAKCGFPRNREDLLTTVQKIVNEDKRKNNFKDGRPGKQWYVGFLKRHPILAIRQPESISKGRAIVTENSIRKWFADLRSYLESNQSLDILQDPARIFNGDETSFCLSPKSGTVLAARGAKNILKLNATNDKETLTVLLLFSACGKTLPPMVVFPYLRPPAAISKSMPDNWILGRSESGWMKSETFFEYIANGLHKWLQEENIKRPILLFVDGHKSHFSIPMSEFCRENGIILYSLPPNTTHMLQPADVGAFKGLKQDYKQTVRSWQCLPENVGKPVTKINFCSLLSMVLNKKDRTDIVKNAFRKCGLFPFNPDAVDFTKCVQDVLQKGRITKSQFSKDEIQTTIKVIEGLKPKFIDKKIDFQSCLDVVREEAEDIDDCSVDGSVTSSILGEYVVEESGMLTQVAPDATTNSLPLSTSDISNLCHQIEDVNYQFLNFDNIEFNNTLEYTLIPEDNAELEDTADTTLTNTPQCSKTINQNTNNAIENDENIDTTNVQYSSFEKHLYYPKAIETSTRRPKEKAPMAVSSLEWKNHYEKKMKEVELKKKEIIVRKQMRLKRKKDNEMKKMQKHQKRNKKKKTACPACNDEVQTDAENDEMSSIGCDTCDLWFHLKCTHLASLPFMQAQTTFFSCNLCTKN